jgi:hypothetical protein
MGDAANAAANAIADSPKRSIKFIPRCPCQPDSAA